MLAGAGVTMAQDLRIELAAKSREIWPWRALPDGFCGSWAATRFGPIVTCKSESEETV